MYVEEAGAGETGRECESETKIFLAYLFNLFVYFKCSFLSPCVEAIVSFSCFVYWKIYLIDWLTIMVDWALKTILSSYNGHGCLGIKIQTLQI